MIMKMHHGKALDNFFQVNARSPSDCACVLIQIVIFNDFVEMFINLMIGTSSERNILNSKIIRSWTVLIPL